MTYLEISKKKLVASTLGLALSCSSQLPPVTHPASIQTQYQTSQVFLEPQCQIRDRSFWFRNTAGQENLIDQMLPQGSRHLTTICRRNFAVVVTPSAIYNIPFDRSADGVSSFYETSINPPFSLDLRFASDSRSLFVLDHFEPGHRAYVHIISIDPNHRFDNFSCNLPNAVLSDQTQIGLIPGALGQIVIAPITRNHRTFSVILGKISTNRCGPFSEGDSDFMAPGDSSFFELSSRADRLFFGNRQRSISFWVENGNYQAETTQ